VSHDSRKEKHDPLTLGIIIGLRANLSIKGPRKLYLRCAYRSHVRFLAQGSSTPPSSSHN
jgi:hypothetical protein